MMKSTKSMVWGIVWIIGACLVWYYLAGNPLHELALIQHGKTVPGVIISAYDEPSEDDGSYSGWMHWIEYTYHVDGRKFSNTDNGSGQLRQGLNIPCPIKVEYLPNNPAVSRIKNTGSGNIQSWLLFKVGLGSLLLVILCSPGASLFLKGMKDLRCQSRIT